MSEQYVKVNQLSVYLLSWITWIKLQWNMHTVDVVSTVFGIVNCLISKEQCNVPWHVTPSIDSVLHVVVITRHRVVEPDAIRHSGRYKELSWVTLWIFRWTRCYFSARGTTLPWIIIASCSMQDSIRCSLRCSCRSTFNKQQLWNFTFNLFVLVVIKYFSVVTSG